MNLLEKSFLLLFLICGNVFADYNSDREAILAQEASQLIGSSIILSEKESMVNDILMKIKLKEYDEGIVNPARFLPSKHFFQSKYAIEQSDIFKIIKMLPKGASLHSHSSAMVSFDFLFNLTFSHNLYGCDDNGTFKLHFFGDVVNDTTCQWRALSEWREENPKFDDFIKSQMTLVVSDPVAVYEDINAVWRKFNKIFGFLHPLFDYRPFIHDYFYQVFQEFHEDNVMYLEMRGSFGKTFDSSGVIYEASETLQFYLDILEEFHQITPEFLGFRWIYARGRKVTAEQMEQNIDEYLQFQKRYPEIIAGFDLVGQEDVGEPLITFAEQLLSLANKTKFFFHAGETSWNGASPDLNLIDAVLLNTSRIGHGFALPKHTEVLRIVKDRQIAVELNPISNQVLKLVDDFRNHPGNSLIAGGYPVVVTCDDPTFWGAKGLSYDWYLAFMGMVPRNGDLRVLKQLALNSLIYSSLDSDNKPYYLALFEGRWDEFLNKVLEKYS